MAEEPTSGAGTEPGKPAGPHRWKPGESGNPAGSSAKGRFKAALYREMRRRALAADADEFDQLARRYLDLVEKNDKAAVALLKDVQAREDGPLETRLAGHDGGALPVHVVMELVDEKKEDQP